jgi:beta-lactamase regulating signal transducer with metallopeptidase domain
MSAAVLETLAWTGALIALVLLLRRPVARAFGPQYAYALWALPVLRLVLPPLTLPAWMAPAAPAAPVVATRATLAEPIAWQAESVPATFTVAAPGPAPAEPAFDLFVWLDSLPLAEALLLVWLGGAAVFLWRRFAAYFELREQLLAEAREVGSARGPLGPIRLVETPGTAAPLAFGVLDPVIALPLGFMALHDRRARDLALAHELAHHRGLDLLVNVAVQPLFALHWFTPLATYGWLALRRDQEAACDARVIARSSAEERAAYARLIAGFAAGPNLALAAPMACPVLGEKSIIERLRSLTMSHTSPRRRFAGRALLGLGLLALPLTATISYAASEDVPAVPEPPAPPAPPAPPSPPAPPAPPEAPEPPLPPEAPQPPEAGEDVEVIEQVIRGEDGKEKRIRMVFRGHSDPAAQAAEMRALAESHRVDQDKMMAELREGLAEADRALAEMPRVIAQAQAASGEAQRVIVMNNCNDEPTETVTDKDGKKTILFCQSRVIATARQGLEEARAEIAADKDIPEETRRRILKELDRSIARWTEKEG